jgi:aspartyl-tRNA(Asn)/glutamyl-tRNA(Gln) amidotransferase subunit A
MAVPLTIADAGAALRAGETTSVALTEALLGRIEALQPQLGAFVTVTGESALAAAAAADAAFAAGTDAGPLQGIPLGIKDIISTKDAPTTANSRVLAPGWGGGVDAPVVARLRDAGAVAVGKTTTMEFAIGMPDPDKGFAVPWNPWDLERTPAGSSSGTGIAVSTGMVLGGLGTDTGGSVRGPASVNGHTGLKVTFGRVPKNGVVPLGFTLDSVGPMARSALDCALLLGVMAGYDAGDPYASPADVPDYAAALTGDVEGLRIGIPTRYFFDVPELEEGYRDLVLAAVDELTAAGAVVTEVDLPLAAEAKNANGMTMMAEAFAYHRLDMAGRWNDYGRSTRAVVARASLLTAADYVQAQRIRTVWRRQVAGVLADVDVLVTPTATAPAARVADMDVSTMVTAPSFMGQWNLAGLPACAAPAGFLRGLPASLQVVGRPFAEATVLKVVDAYQRRTDWHLRVPPIAAATAA